MNICNFESYLIKTVRGDRHFDSYYKVYTIISKFQRIGQTINTESDRQ